MNKLIVEKENFKKNTLFEIINRYLSDYLKNSKTFIFDIHNTIEYGDKNKIDDTIFKFIKKNYKTYNFILLSYDGNHRRIQFNNDILDNYSDIFKKIPKIFIKKRKKHYIIGYISKILINKYKNSKDIYFIDDNYNNIVDANKLRNIDKFNIIHYTAHTNRVSDVGVEDLKDYFKKV